MTNPYPPAPPPQQPPQHHQPHQPPGGSAAPPPQGGGGQGQSAIAVTTKFLWLAWFFVFLKPKLFINGHEVPGTWGRNVVPMPPGQHHLQIFVPYLLPPQVGKAEMPVTLQPGQTVELEYRAPVFAFSPGALGVGEQKWNGLGITVGIFAGLLALICLCCGGSFLLSVIG